MPLQISFIPYHNTGCPHYYLCRYLPASIGKDTLSHSLLKFKRGRQPDLDAWIDCSLDLLAPPGSPIIAPGTILLRALHHDETSVRETAPTSLDKLGKALARRLEGHYRPRLLRKSRPTREIKLLSKEQRISELQDVYRLENTFLTDPGQPLFDQTSSATENPTSSTAGDPPSFLIIDDILTTGATLSAIIEVLHCSYPAASLAIFTLAKADYDPTLNSSSPMPD